MLILFTNHKHFPSMVEEYTLLIMQDHLQLFFWYKLEINISYQ